MKLTFVCVQYVDVPMLGCLLFGQPYTQEHPAQNRPDFVGSIRLDLIKHFSNHIAKLLCVALAISEDDARGNHTG